MNNIQKISLIIAGISFTYWIFAALDQGFDIFRFTRWDDGFDKWYLQLSFAIFVGSIISFFVFKTASINIINKWKEFSSKEYFKPLSISVLIIVLLTIINKNEWQIKSHINDETLKWAFSKVETATNWDKLGVSNAVKNAVDWVDVDNYLIFSIIKYEDYEIGFDNSEYDYIGYSILGFVNYENRIIREQFIVYFRQNN